MILKYKPWQLWFLVLAFTVPIITISACSPTVMQSEKLSDVGIKYTEAVNELIEVTTDAIIDADSDNLLYIQRLTSLADKKEEKQQSEKRLREHDEQVKKLVATLGSFRGYTATLKTYFINLQDLARTDAPESAAKAVEELSASINHANNTLLKTEKLGITDKEKEAFGSLAGLTVKGYKSAQLQEALKRDASIIAEQLLLHEKLLIKLGGILKHSTKKAYADEWKTKILKPYRNKNISSPTSWKKERKRLLKSTFFVTTLDNAEKAAKQMRLVWANILEGKTDLQSIGLLLNDINELTAVLQQLKEAAKEDEGG